MTSLSPSTVTELSDAQLVELSRSGDREAFSSVVRRYQSLVCALAYSACGNVTQSEDIAQDAFIAAWKQLADLREPARLKEWLCGIARHLAVQAYRRDLREPARLGVAFTGADVAPEPPPFVQAMRQDEESMLWRALAQLPGTYREVLVLYYREHRSIEHVAIALDLSEDNIRQRLSRGRKALQDEVTKMLEATLAHSAPGPRFTTAVLGALPPISTVGSALAAGSSAVKGGTAVKAGFIGLGALTGWLSGLILPLVGMFLQLHDARSADERKRVISTWATLWLGCAVFVGGLFALSFGSRFFWTAHPHQRALILIVCTAFYTLVFGAFIWSCMAGRTSIWSRRTSPARDQPEYEFRSRASFLGLPLIHIRAGRREDGRLKAAIGWIAIGRVAYGGVLACGVLTVAPISLGALSLGLVSFGCIGVGGFTVGSLAFGCYALGGIAVGYLAWGGCALGWHAASGGAVWARDFALGGRYTTIAAHANGPIARQALGNMFFFRHSQALFALGILAVWAPLVVSFWWRRRRDSGATFLFLSSTAAPAVRRRRQS